jgi:hypothetical protein
MPAKNNLNTRKKTTKTRSEKTLSKYGLNRSTRGVNRPTANNLINIWQDGDCPLAYLVGTNNNNRNQLVRTMGRHYQRLYPQNNINVNTLVHGWEWNADCPLVHMGRLTPEQTRNMWKKVLNLYNRQVQIRNKNLQTIRVNFSSQRSLNQINKAREHKKDTNRLKAGVLKSGSKLPINVMIPILSKARPLPRINRRLRRYV